MRTINTLICFCLSSAILSGQDDSYQTFNAIRLENSSNPGAFVQLNAPTGLTSYNLTLPATGPLNTTQRWAFSLNGSNNALSWYATPLGNTNQIAYFTGTESIVSGSNLTWNPTTQQMGVSGTLNNTLLSLTKSGAITGNDTLLMITATSTGSTAISQTLLELNASSTLTAGTRRGLHIAVTGATNNYAAIFESGRVGVGVVAPNTTFDVSGTTATREFNYTANLSATNNNVDFTGDGNTSSFVRVGSTTSGTVSITGFAGGSNGKVLTVYNATGYGLRLEHNDAGSTAANRIKAPNSTDFVIIPGAAYQLVYSETDQRWIVAFSGPGEITTLGNANVTVTTSSSYQLPSSMSSYIQVTSNCPGNDCFATFEDGISPGQILVVQNLGPDILKFSGSNFAPDNSTNLQDDESIPFIWNGTKWVQMAEASN